MNIRILLRLNWILIIWCVAATAAAQRNTMPGSARAPKKGFSGNAKGIEILNRLEAAFDAQDPVYMEVTSTHTLTPPNARQQSRSQSSRIWIRRPNKLVWTSEGNIGWNIVSDGKRLCMYLPSEKIYTLQAMDKKRLDTELLPLNELHGVTLIHLIAGSLRGSQPVVLNRGEDLGPEDFGGLSLHHVRLGAGTAIIDLWLNAKELPVRIMETESGAVSGTFLTTVKWITGQPIPDSAFVIAPPADAKSVNVLFGLPPMTVSPLGTTETATTKKQ